MKFPKCSHKSDVSFDPFKLKAFKIDGEIVSKSKDMLTIEGKIYLALKEDPKLPDGAYWLCWEVKVTKNP